MKLELDGLDFDGFDFGFDIDVDVDIKTSSEQQKIPEGKAEGVKEYEPEEFNDEQFKCECPRCGFKFNP